MPEEQAALEALLEEHKHLADRVMQGRQRILRCWLVLATGIGAITYDSITTPEHLPAYLSALPVLLGVWSLFAVVFLIQSTSFQRMRMIVGDILDERTGVRNAYWERDFKENTVFATRLRRIVLPLLAGLSFAGYIGVSVLGYVELCSVLPEEGQRNLLYRVGYLIVLLVLIVSNALMLWVGCRNVDTASKTLKQISWGSSG